MKDHLALKYVAAGIINDHAQRVALVASASAGTQFRAGLKGLLLHGVV